MKIKLTRGTVAAKKMRPVGEIVEVGEEEGKFLITIGKAVGYTPEPKPEPAEKAEEKPKPAAKVNRRRVKKDK